MTSRFLRSHISRWTIAVGATYALSTAAGCKSRAFNQPGSVRTVSVASESRARPPANPEVPGEYARSLARLVRSDGAYLCNALLVGARTLLTSAACGDLARRSPGEVRAEFGSAETLARRVKPTVARERPRGPAACAAGLDSFTFLDDLPAGTAEAPTPPHSPAALDGLSPSRDEDVVVASWGLPGTALGAGRFRVRRIDAFRFRGSDALPLGPRDGGAIAFAVGPADTTPRLGKDHRDDVWDRLSAKAPNTPLLRARGINEGPGRDGFLDLTACRLWVSSLVDHLEPESAPGGADVQPDFE